MDEFDDITKVFYIMYDNLLTNKNQNKFGNNLGDLVRKYDFTKFNKITNVKSLILNLKQEFSFAYKISLLLYVKCDLFYKIIQVFPYVSDQFVSNFEESNESKILEFVTRQNNNISTHIMYIDAFNFYNYKMLEVLEEDPIDLTNTKTTKTNMKSWEIATRIEIINCLILIVGHFTLDTLKKMNIKLITYKEANELSFKQLSKYYNKQLIKIKKCLKIYRQYCSAYTEIEKSFIMALLTFDTTISFLDFDLVIEEKINGNLEDNFIDIIDTQSIALDSDTNSDVCDVEKIDE